MMVAQERYKPLDANSKPYVGHGRDGLPAVWVGMWVWIDSFGQPAGS